MRQKSGPRPVSRSLTTGVRISLLILLLSTLFRLFTIGQFDLGNDEAHYFMYAAHPDLSYFDHPLMVALLVRTGMALAGVSSFGVRFFAPILFLLSTVVLSMIAVFIRPRPGILLRTVLLVNAVPLFGFLGSMLMIPDAPLSVFWLLYVLVAMVLFTRFDSLPALARVQGWILLGCLFGLALLSKYNGILLVPATFLLFLLDRRLRPLLFSPGPYLAFSLGLLVALPLFLWNFRHGGSSFLFQTAHGFGGIHFDWVHFYQMVFGQIGYLSPILFILLLWALWKNSREKKDFSSPPGVRILVLFSAVPLLFFNGIGLLHPILPHWPAMGYLTAIPLLALAWENSPGSRLSAWIRYGAWLGAGLSLAVTIQLFFRPIVLPKRVPLWVDISNDLFGFRRLAGVVREEVGRHPELVGGKFFYAAEHFNTADELAFYLGHPYHTICLKQGVTQFDFWNDPHQFLGGNGIFVSTDKYRVDPSLFYPKGTFDRIVALPPVIIDRRGSPARVFYVYWLIGFRSVPWRK